MLGAKVGREEVDVDGAVLGIVVGWKSGARIVAAVEAVAVRCMLGRWTADGRDGEGERIGEGDRGG